MRQFAEVVPEHLFVEVAKQMERLNTHVGSLQSALEETPEILKPVGVNLSINVTFRVIDNLMFESLFLESHIRHERIGVDRAASGNVGIDMSLQFFLATHAYDSSANFSTTFQDTHDSS